MAWTDPYHELAGFVHQVLVPLRVIHIVGSFTPSASTPLAPCHMIYVTSFWPIFFFPFFSPPEMILTGHNSYSPKIFSLHLNNPWFVDDGFQDIMKWIVQTCISRKSQSKITNSSHSFLVLGWRFASIVLVERTCASLRRELSISRSYIFCHEQRQNFAAKH